MLKWLGRFMATLIALVVGLFCFAFLSPRPLGLPEIRDAWHDPDVLHL